ncbi:UBP-type zinc finger domain-containing protein [Gordonia sp. TBRC 11910]|uniref:UBP-type zinc finger domain-containing protein n=1 Tax=Gordonia asplenii TaxID=2725283 RepID=A0A848KZM0_9ACTN|nr:UBP-type zinc finger domain-containing protein [Gordonia asplenii]NMO01641.1 UBP-type zinc finger domain-containing protein [Gordonia asplenii]
MANQFPGPSGDGCVECEASGSWWFHLRRCVECGHVGCCDDSLNRHATAHFATTGHRYIRSYEPGEVWFWDFENETGFEGPDLPPPLHHPLDQTVPGPADRVPADWDRQLTERRR